MQLIHYSKQLYCSYDVKMTWRYLYVRLFNYADCMPIGCQTSWSVIARNCIFSRLNRTNPLLMDALSANVRHNGALSYRTCGNLTPLLYTRRRRLRAVVVYKRIDCASIESRRLRRYVGDDRVSKRLSYFS